MDLFHIFIVGNYEAKVLGRHWLFQLFAVLFIGWMAYGLSNRLYFVYFPFTIPYVSAHLLGLIHSLLLFFAVSDFFRREYKSDFIPVLQVRPVSNRDYFIGKWMGMFILFLVVNLLGILAAVCVDIFLSATPFNPLFYFFYFFTLTLPVLVFALGLAMWLFGLIRNYMLGGLLYLGVMAFGCFFLMDYRHGIYDVLGRSLPNAFSEFTGFTDMGGYLLQRLSFLPAGIGLFIFAIGQQRRIPNRPQRTGFIGTIFLLTAIALFGKQEYFYYHQDHTRMVYRQTYLKYDGEDKVNIKTHDIRFQLNGKHFTAESQVLVYNPSGEKPTVLLYLNPFLQIAEISSGDLPLKFQRENQVVVIDKSISPEEELSLTIRYGGAIDGTICNLDIPDSIYYKRVKYMEDYTPMMKLRDRFFWFGKQFAFLSPSFTLLHPECLWYPVSRAPMNLSNPAMTVQDYTRYTLHVKEHPLIPVSQGTPTRDGEGTLFSSRYALPGISLAMGDYVHKRALADSTWLEMYYLRGHDFFFDGFNPSPERLKEIARLSKEQEERWIGYAYPFDRFIMVETPYSFHSFVHEWKGAGEYLQPEILFFPEKGRFNFDAGRFRSFTEQRSRTNLPDEMVEEYFLPSFLHAASIGKEYNRGNAYAHFMGEIVSDTYPGFNMVLRNLLDSRIVGVDGTNAIRSKLHQDICTYSMSDYLVSHSLREALWDSTLSLSEKQHALWIKSEQLLMELSVLFSKERVQEFIRDYKTRNLFTLSDVAQFAREFDAEFNYSLTDKLTAWYAQKGVPAFLVKNITLERVHEEEGLVMNVDVFNQSDIDGVVSLLRHEGRGNYSSLAHSIGWRNYFSRSYLIKARESKRIRLITYGLTTRVVVNTHFSLNRPQGYEEYPLGHLPYTTASTVGIFDIDSTDFFPREGEIVVDNEDPGFRLIAPKQRSRLFKQRGNPNSILPIKTGWIQVVTKDSYGGVSRSGHFKAAHQGEYKAIWETEIKTPGYYDLFFHHQKMQLVNNFSTLHPGTRFYYTVTHAEGNTTLVVDIDQETTGWVPLGKFYMSAGKAEIILDDRGGDISHEFFTPLTIADAVKWVYVDDATNQ